MYVYNIFNNYTTNNYKIFILFRFWRNYFHIIINLLL